MECAYLDADDLGFSHESSECRELSEALGAPPPWSLASMKEFFDDKFHGWDAPPAIPGSSPVARLRRLGMALQDARNEGLDGVQGASATVDAALRHMATEVEHARVRLMCPRVDGSCLDAECHFLLLMIEQLGDLLVSQGLEYRHERSVSKRELAEAREAVVSAGQDAAAADKFRQRLDDAITEAEVCRQHTDILHKQNEELLVRVKDFDELETRASGLESEVVQLRKELEATQLQFLEVKAQKAALVVAHQESEETCSDLERRLARDDPFGAQSHADSLLQGGPGRGHVVVVSAGGCGHVLRAAFMALKCHRLEAQNQRFVNATGSLEADLSVARPSPVPLRTGCCCKGHGRCCRVTWLDAALKQNAQLHWRLSAAQADLAVGGGWWRSLAIVFFMTTVFFALVVYEPVLRLA